MTFSRSLAIWGASTLLLVLIGIVHSAFASDATTVDFSPIAALLREYAAVVIDAVIVAAIGWGMRLLHLSGNNQAAQFAETIRQFLHDTAERGLDRALSLAQGSIGSVDVRSQVLASALFYLQANAPDAVRRLGASPDDLRRLLEAKLGARGQIASPPAAPT